MTPFYADDWLTVFHGDCRAVMAGMEPESVHCVVTSPPFWGLRDYGVDGQLGLEPTPDEYVANLVDVFREVRRVLRADGTVWLNLGDSYASGGGSGPQRLDELGVRLGTGGGHKHSSQPSGRAPSAGLAQKQLVGIPWRVAFALQADGWYLRSDIIWSKPNPMPESVTDRPTKSHEYIFLLSKSPTYFFDQDAVREVAIVTRAWPEIGPAHQAARLNAGGPTAIPEVNPAGRNIRSVWTMATQPYGNVRVKRAGYGGSGHKASPDCPVHAGLGQKASTAGRDAPLDASDPARSPHNGRHPEPAPLAELVPIAQPLDADSAPGSLGSLALAGGSTATLHSSETHRTDRAPGILPREIDAEGSSSRIGHTSPDADSDANGDRTPASSTAAGSDEGEPRSDPSGRTPDDTTCTCSYWESVSHFAVFPPKLIEPCIKAGTSEKGVCPECGAPWERVVERTTPVSAELRPKDPRIHLGHSAKSTINQSNWHDERTRRTTFETTDWRPTCACCTSPDCILPTHGRHSGPIPATVLDPFAGSGTTGMVAQSLSRRAVLIDLSLDYLGQLMARNADIPLGLGA